jgi:hypothetical protein
MDPIFGQVRASSQSINMTGAWLGAAPSGPIKSQRQGVLIMNPAGGASVFIGGEELVAGAVVDAYELIVNEKLFLKGTLNIYAKSAAGSVTIRLLELY